MAQPPIAPSYNVIRLVTDAAKDGARKATETCSLPPDHVKPTVGLALALAAVEQAMPVMTLGEFQEFIAQIWESPDHVPN